MMTMIVFNKQQHISMVARQTIASVRVQVQIIHWHVDGADCCLIGIVLGVRTTKKYPPITILPNICEYCPVPNNPIPVSF